MDSVRICSAVLLFAAACNLDTVILAMGYAVRGVRVSAGQALMIGGVTTRSEERRVGKECRL